MWPLLLALCAPLSCGRSGGPEGAAGVASTPTAESVPLRVTRGTLDDRILLSGDIEAVTSDILVVPQTPDPLMSVTWLAEDGAMVKKGDRIAEFDSSVYAATLEDKRATLEGAESELLSEAAKEVADLAEKTIAVEHRRVDVEEAVLKATVPADLESPREHQEKQLAVTTARFQLAKAEDDLATLKRTAALDRSVKQVAKGRAQRELSEIEQRLHDLTLVAPHDGLLLIAMQRSEGRKILVGDKLWFASTVATMPDLSVMRVRARLSDVDDGAVRVGMAGECVLDAYPQRRWPATVQGVSSLAAPASRDNPRRSFDVLLGLDGPTSPLWRPGMSARIEVIRRHAADVLLVPRAALPAWPGPTQVRLVGGGTQAVEVDFCAEMLCAARGALSDGTMLVPATAAGQGR